VWLYFLFCEFYTTSFILVCSVSIEISREEDKEPLHPEL
jgi:hypothetical protein